jgi:hypothetical protein
MHRNLYGGPTREIGTSHLIACVGGHEKEEIVVIEHSGGLTGVGLRPLVKHPIAGGVALVDLKRDCTASGPNAGDQRQLIEAVTIEHPQVATRYTDNLAKPYGRIAQCERGAEDAGDCQQGHAAAGREACHSALPQPRTAEIA